MRAAATLGALVLLLAAAAGTPAAAQSEGRASLLEQKLALVERLLASARERHGEDGGDRDPLASIDELLGSARTQLAAGSLDDAERALDQALRQVAAVTRRARAQSSRPELEDRYRELLAGVRAFRAAFASVVAEKGAATATVLDGERLDALMRGAEEAAREQRYAQGVRLLADAYHMLSLALSEARANETLEHRLVFESPAHEYRYERDRYRSHELLVKLMVAEREPAPETLALIHGEMEQAMALDDRARVQADGGDFTAAIASEEAAVEHLVKALQRGGLFVPR